MKNKSMNILIVALLLLSLMSITLIVFLDDAHNRFKQDITVNAGGVTEEIMAVRDLHLNPTESREYSVNFTCAASGLYDFAIEYIEEKDGGMKNFVNVNVRFGDELLYSGRLADLFLEDVVLEFQGELHATEPVTVKFSYGMPYEVGNEAQGTSADFDIRFTVSKA